MRTRIRRWQVVTTSSVGVLSVVASLLGLFRPGHYLDAPAFRPQLFAQDVTMLVVGVPALAIGLWLAVQGSHRGRFVWLGALAYMTYMWASVGLQVAFNQFFLGYVALFCLSLFTFVGGVVTTDADEVAEPLVGSLPERVYAGFLLLVATGLAFLWLSELVPATLTGTTPRLVEEVGPQAMASHFIDLSVVVPGLGLSSLWLWQGRPWGYVLAGVGVVFGAILAPTLTLGTVLLATGGAVTVSLVSIAFTVLPALVAAALAVKYVIALPRNSEREAVGEVGRGEVR
ncbi:hypothetical protein [Haloferax marisrubri]|uniref:Uncharacterized protein n=1 Tax=Haloferax marisrubri TaxID=1544719 RepID=A0A2P4NRP1_9EURY|nr:hypothetical protein [Haloferax marisrubri]POG55748.1 hypothetical protein AUR65_010185 [Haloferax marisrubri]